MYTKKQKLREHLAKLLEQIGGKNCESAKQCRAVNRRIDQRKRKQSQS